MGSEECGLKPPCLARVQAHAEGLPAHPRHRAGLPLALPDRDHPAVAPREVVTTHPRGILLAHLEHAIRLGQSDARSRVLATIGTVLDTGCRTGPLGRVTVPVTRTCTRPEVLIP